MKAEQAAEVMGVLEEGYRTRLTSEQRKVWFEQLRTRDHEIAVKAARAAISRVKFFPSVAEFLEFYGKERRIVQVLEQQQQRQPEQRRSDIPEWVHVWHWQLERTRLKRQQLNTSSRQPVAERPPVKMRDFPQYQDPGPDAYTEVEYEKIRRGWEAAGKPLVRSALDVVRGF